MEMIQMRSIEDFNRRVEIERKREREIKRQRDHQLRMAGGRGLDNFFYSSQDYYQEAEEMEEDMDDEDLPTLDDEDDMTDGMDDSQPQEEIDDDDLPTLDDEDDDTMLVDTEEPQLQEEPSNDTDEDLPTLDDESDDGYDVELLEIDNTDDTPDDDPIKTFGQHGGDDLPNNQYDPKEITRIMEFVADEAKALSDYMEAAKTSKIDILQRLYSDIGDEERYHLEQLLFAKAEITGEKYVPRDPDIRKEYEELISYGMDEGSAMTTAVDKFNLHSASKEANDAAIENAVEDVQEAYQEMERAFIHAETLRLVMEQAKYTNDYRLSNQILMLEEPSFYQEDISVTVNQQYNKQMSPFKILVTLIGGIFKLFGKIINGIKTFIEKGNHRFVKALEWLRRHKLRDLFADGVMLYMWDDRTNNMDVDPLLYYANCCWALIQEAVGLSKLRANYASQVMQIKRLFQVNTPKYSGKPPAVTAYKYATSLDPIKTKVAITDQNQAGIMKVFFTSYQEDQQYLNNDFHSNDFDGFPADGVQVKPPLTNYLYILDKIAKTLTPALQVTRYVADELAGLEADDRSVWRTNPKVYETATQYMQAAVKGFQKLSKICADDFATVNKLLEKALNN